MKRAAFVLLLCAVLSMPALCQDEPYAPEMVLIPGGEFEMGDHQGFVDPRHSSDEVPIHLVRLDSFYIGRTETTNAQYLEFLQSAIADQSIEVREGIVYAAGTDEMYCYTSTAVSWSSISWDNASFSIDDFRSNHPMVGVMWEGAVAYCNWLSAQHGYTPCYNLATKECDFSKNGYRLPTEAEWEYTGRGGVHDPYCMFPWGNETDSIRANWPRSNDPYETGSYPWTTPVGFYDGSLRLKSDYHWPDAMQEYQTADGGNGYGLFDMSGNVWEFVNDWYFKNYYSESPNENPHGPASGSIQRDGKPYRGMRGGNWFNGQWGHGRVANRNPSYYRGPQDPDHPWYHVGFRVARAFSSLPTGIGEDYPANPTDLSLLGIVPNPVRTTASIYFTTGSASHVILRVFDIYGRCVATLDENELPPGEHQRNFDAAQLPAGIYYFVLQAGPTVQAQRMVILR